MQLKIQSGLQYNEHHQHNNNPTLLTIPHFCALKKLQIPHYSHIFAQFLLTFIIMHKKGQIHPYYWDLGKK